MSVVDNIRLPPTLLSRFDMIYLVLDKESEALDRRLANHIVSLYSIPNFEENDDDAEGYNQDEPASNLIKTNHISR